MRCSVFSLGCVAVAAIVFSSSAPASGEVVAHYTFDTDYNDSSANANHGAAVDGNSDSDTDGVSITTTAGEWKFGGGAANFAAERDYVGIPTLSFGNGEVYSVAFWVRKAAGDTTQAAEWDMVIGQANNSNNFISLNGQDPENPYIRWRNVDRSAQADFATSTAGDSDVWHHYAFVAGDFEDDDTTVDEIRLYIDGTLFGTQDINSTGSTTSQQTAFACDAIGEGYLSSSDFDMHGQIDEVWIFDEALSGDVIADLYQYNTTEPVPEPSSLVLALGGLLALGWAGRRSRRAHG